MNLESGRNNRKTLRNLCITFCCFIISFGLFSCSRQTDLFPEDTGQPAVDLALETENIGTIKLKSVLGNAEDYNQITSGNLFDKEREPPPEGTPVGTPISEGTGQQPVNIPNLKLVGTINMGGGISYAFIIDTKNSKLKNKIQRFKLGDKIGDYEITDVGADRVAFQKGEELAVLKLKPTEGKKGSRSKKPPRNSRGKMRTSGRDKNSQQAGGVSSGRGGIDRTRTKGTKERDAARRRTDRGNSRSRSSDAGRSSDSGNNCGKTERDMKRDESRSSDSHCGR